MPSRTQAATDAIYQLKITLKRSKPPIWRRLQIRGDTRLATLHRIIQVAMGWHNCHLHQFIVDREFYGVPDADDWFEVHDEVRTALNQLGKREKNRFTYQYDFGDSWDHEILIERILPPDPATHYPICLTGKRACPPEDVGGVWGYGEFLEAISDPQHGEHKTMIDWIGGTFESERFNLIAVNARLRGIK